MQSTALGWRCKSLGLKAETIYVTRRKRLKQFLETEIDLIKESDGDQDLVDILSEAVVGLESLDSGQVDKIFAPVTTGMYGLHPATVRRYEAHAVGLVLALKKRGYTIAKAEEDVATAFDIEPDALHKWRMNIPKSKDEPLLEILALYKTTTQFPFGPLPIKPLLDEIKRKGEFYQTLGPKSGKKGP
jgi:hypothetical protein